MRSFTTYLYESKGNWIRPDDASIRKEYQIEYKKHLVHALPKDIFPTEDAFLKAVKASPTVTVTPSVDRQISNRSRTPNMESLLDLIKGYRSYPQFRNEKTLKDLEKRIVDGKPTDMPIVVKFPNRGMRIFSGNTRMDIAFMHDINPTVILLDLSPYLKESKSQDIQEANRGINKEKNKWVDLKSDQVRGNKNIQKDIYDIIRTAYAPVGGHHDFPSPSSVPHDQDSIQIVDVDTPDDVDATLLSKSTPYGKKITTLGSDGSTEAKKQLLIKAVKLINTDGNYMEVSGKIADILISRGAPTVNKEDIVRKVLQGKEITWHGEHPEGSTKVNGWYTRMIGGQPKTKIMVGKPRA